ncbi:MAG: hypothetical protein QME52_06540 [Bacteroidota bacterium]|nr:hypothetical protein [Bacteroidota bacterium]
MKVLRYLLLIILVGVILNTFVFCQEHVECSDAELKAEVPELSEFHDVIYKIWHNAWPEKDIKMLVELLPEVEQGSEKVISAELPGILRDKKQAWQENIEKLKFTVDEYKSAASPIDSQKLLDAAENLHTQYEKLFRTIRPILKEIEDFHTTLYTLYHYYMPEDNKDKVKSSIKELKEKMNILNKASLPERRKSREKEFIAARTKLSKSVDDLVKSLKKYNSKKVNSKIEVMHSNYQALEKVFE